jgi:predicted enzyme related to lactoylglutathione lyase
MLYGQRMASIDLFYLPVPDLTAALAYYRDTLGWQESWREGDTTAALTPPGGGAQLMIDVDTQGDARPGPIVVVDDARSWIADRDTLKVTLEPTQIPGGWWAAFDDPFGNAVYVLDQSTAGEA